MREEDLTRRSPESVPLRDGRTAQVRPLSPGDGEALGDFYQTVPRGDIRFYCPYDLTRETAVSRVEAAFSPLEIVLVLEMPDLSIGGYAWCRWPEPGSDLSHFGICVRTDVQELGAGTALMSRVIEAAADLGPPGMRLTVQLANTRALRLYRRMGFQVVAHGVRRADPKYGFEDEPEYLMELQLRSEERERNWRVASAPEQGAGPGPALGLRP